MKIYGRPFQFTLSRHLEELQRAISPNDDILFVQKMFRPGRFKKKDVGGFSLKPSGLWWAKGSEWVEWSRWNNWMNQGFVYKLTLDKSRYLFIDSEQALVRLQTNYPKNVRDYGDDFRLVDWYAVARDYTGIEFNPYLWNLRLDRRFTWYSSVDVPSGCTWDESTVISLQSFGPIGGRLFGFNY